MGKLDGKKVAVLVADGFEQVEMTGPRAALQEAGATAHLISPAPSRVQGWNHFDRGETFPVDVQLDAADAGQYDALLLPGGVANPDQLRVLPAAVALVKAFFEAGKPVAAICHGPWMLIEADVVRGRKLTSWPSLQTDLRNAGATWLDQSVVTDGGLVTSRKPDDIPDFTAKMIEEFAEGHHDQQVQAAEASDQTGSDLVKDPDQWKTGGEPATDAQYSYYRTLSQEMNETPREGLSKADISKEIDRLRSSDARVTA